MCTGWMQILCHFMGKTSLDFCMLQAPQSPADNKAGPVPMDYVGKTISESLLYEYCQQVPVSPVPSNIHYVFSWTCIYSMHSAAQPVRWLRRRLLSPTFVGPLGFQHKASLLIFSVAQKNSKGRDRGSCHTIPCSLASTYSHCHTSWFAT